MERRGVVFDLDDTLYLERDYVRSGFRSVSRAVALESEGRLAADMAFDALWEWFEGGVRGDTFDRLRDRFPEVSMDTAEMVRVYRHHEPDIALLPAMRELLTGLRARGIMLGLLSDGPLSSQRAKFDALGVAQLFEAVVFTDQLGREHWKPAATGFQLLEERLALQGDVLAYVGDNPLKDFIAPNERQWLTVRLRVEGQLRAEVEAAAGVALPQREVGSVDGLFTCLGVS